jgi:(S)-2-hydroxy-acid oxidase
LEVLPSIVSKLKETNCEVYIDGGVSTGTDIFKALALGAKMVFVGRPALWGLACGGQQGVERILAILKKELEITMVLSGLIDITHNSTRSKNYIFRSEVC